MKKTSTIVKEKSTFEISILINNTAYIQSITGKTGLLNIKTNELIGEMANYYTIYDTHNKFYYQTSEAKVAGDKKNLVPGTVIRIYDASYERMLVDNWVVVESFEQYYHIASLRCPSTGKLHLFDLSTCRKPTSILNMEFDEIKELYEYYGEKYFVVTRNGKKGIYKKGEGLVTPIEFDDIEKMPNIVVYTKDNKKYFVCTGKNGKQSGLFDSISIDEKNKNIAYCKKGNTTYVYNTCSQELLLETEYDEIKYIKKDGDSSNDNIGEFFFLVKEKDKYGITSSQISNEIRKSQNPEAKVTNLLTPNYDEIKYDYGTFYLKKNNKYGIFVGNSYHSQSVYPIYDEVHYLGDSFYAFYTDEKCDIGKVTSSTSYTPCIKDAEIIANLRQGLIYKCGEYYGLLLSNCEHKDIVIPAEYDNISCVGEYYFVFEKEGKKGVMHLGKMLIPVGEYDDLVIGGKTSKYSGLKDADIVYFALKKGDKYELAKRHNYHYVDSDIEFVNNHTFNEITFYKDIMVLKDDINTYIYDYEEKLLRTLPASTIVTPYQKPCDDYDRQHNYFEYFYSVDGVHYYYKEGKFEEIFVEENDFYITTYETDTSSYEAKTLSKEEHDKFCAFIDTQGEEEAEKSLEDMSSNKQTLRQDYPTLTLRKTLKNENSN